MDLHGLLSLGSKPIGGPMLGWVCVAFGAQWAFIVAVAMAVLVAGVRAPRLVRPSAAAQARTRDAGTATTPTD